MSRPGSFSEAEDARIREGYANKEPAGEIAAALGRKVDAIYSRARYLRKRFGDVRAYDVWSPEILETVARMLREGQRDAAIARAIGKTRNATKAGIHVYRELLPARGRRVTRLHRQLLTSLRDDGDAPPRLLFTRANVETVSAYSALRLMLEQGEIERIGKARHMRYRITDKGREKIAGGS